jgi:chromosome segregation protein
MRSSEVAARGAVGRRVLTCLQTIDIGRLTSDPVFLVPGGFIAVTGQGPVDSNESSKTTFEAALSLVHGDQGWRQTSPQFSAYAAELLFNPPNAPAGARVRADVGFIAAVFAQAGQPDAGIAGEADPLTVWVRIRRHDDPAFEATVTPGVRLARGSSNAARIEDAKRIWASLRGLKWGPQVYARALYGPGVSCLSYVSTRGGRSEQRTTLLGSDVSQLTPEQIAWQLIDLAAMRHLFHNEATQRVEFFRLTQQLKEKEQEVSRAQDTVTACTRQAEAISRRSQMLDQAAAARDQHVACTVSQALDELAQHQKDRDAASAAAQQARQDVDEVSERLEALDPATVAGLVARTADERSTAERARQPVADRAGRLRLDIELVERDLQQAADAAAGWSGRPAAAIEAERVSAQTAAEEARTRAALARERQEEATAHLTAVRLGQAGPAGERLNQANIGWHLLDDAVEVSEDARPLFDPLLIPFSGAICVHPDDHADAVAALAGLPGCMLVSGDGTLPGGAIAAPPGASGLLAWLATYGRLTDSAAGIPGLVTVVGGFSAPRTGRQAREAAALAALTAATSAAKTAQTEALDADTAHKKLAQELGAAQAEERRQTLAARRDTLRSEAAAVAEQLAPLNDEFERADAAHRDARAEQRTLDQRMAEVSAHLAACRGQLADQEQRLRDIATGADRVLITAWIGHLDTCEPQPQAALAGQAAGHPPLDLPAEVTAMVRERVREVLAAPPAGSHRESLTRLEADLGVTAKVTTARSEQTRAELDGGNLDAVTHAALVNYHEQAAAVDRRRTRGSEEREISTLGGAITALRAAIDRQGQVLASALTRAEADHARLRDEYDNAYDEVHATDTNLRNIQRSLEHQVRGLFTRISHKFNEIRYRDGGHGGELEFQITPPSLDVPRDTTPGDHATPAGWHLATTPRWARRPPDGGVAEHVPYYEQANTAQYKLATIQLVLAALLANEDPIGRLLILDELGDGLGETHRERVLDALRRAAEETGITVLATVQDDIQDEAFTRCSEVLLLRYRSDTDLLNEPTYMFAGDRYGTHETGLRTLADALTEARGPSWSALLAVYDAAQAAAAETERYLRDAV